MEGSLVLADANGFFDEGVRTQMCAMIANLAYNESTVSKIPDVVSSYMTKAEGYMERFMKATKKPTIEQTLFYATLLVNRATASKDGKIDKARMELALGQTDNLLKLVNKPKESFYQLKLACLTQLGRNEETAELLEVYLKMKPDAKTYWQLLAATYLNLAQATKDDQAAYTYQVRAILTIERAQALGLMSTPTENIQLVAIHFNIQQYEKAIEMLDAGLHNGKIENTQQNWELLYNAYHQINRPAKAIDSLKEAAKQFPKVGQLDYLIAYTYATVLSKPDEAIPFLRSCIAKGGSDRKDRAYVYLAFLAFELKKYDLALEAATQAVKYPDGVKDGTQILNAVKDALSEREMKRQRM